MSQSFTDISKLLDPESQDFLNIRLSKQVLERLADAIRIKIDELRTSSKPDPVYFGALEDILFNFIEKEAQKEQLFLKVENISEVCLFFPKLTFFSPN